MLNRYEYCESARRRADQVRECPHDRIRGFLSPLYTADTSADTRTTRPEGAGAGVSQSQAKARPRATRCAG